MLEPANILKLVHAVVGVWFLAGLIGRWVTLAHAARMTDIGALWQVLQVSARFERIVIIFLTRGRVFDAALEEATMEGVVTDRLRTAVRDPVVFAAHVYELGAMVVVLVLMIAKPF